MTFRILRPAVIELREAANYYEGEAAGLGLEFMTEIRSAIRRILAHPEAWAALDDKFRRCRTGRFPYGIIYTIESDSVLIVAVMHLHREPDSWRKNLKVE